MTTAQQSAATIARYELAAALAAAIQPYEDRAFVAYKDASEAAQEAAAAAILVINLRVELAAAEKELTAAANRAERAAVIVADACNVGEARAEAAYKANGGSHRQSLETAAATCDLILEIRKKTESLAQFTRELYATHITQEARADHAAL